MRTVDYKADKHELLTHNLSLQQAQNQSTEQNTTLDKMELERLYSTLKISMEEADARMSAHETMLSELKNFSESSVEKLASQMSLQL